MQFFFLAIYHQINFLFTSHKNFHDDFSFFHADQTNMTRSVEPGGYLQWEEVDTIGCSIKTVPGVSASNLDTLFSQLKGCDT